MPLDENQRREWENIAKDRPTLRYPDFNLTVFPGGVLQENKVRFQTFVMSSIGGRICYVMETNVLSGQFKFDELVKLTDRFIGKCEMIKEKFIFNKETSIAEPYEFNINP